MGIVFYSAVAIAAVLLLFVFVRTRPGARIRRLEESADSYLSNYREIEPFNDEDVALPEDVALMREFYFRLKDNHKALITDVEQIAGKWAEYSRHKAEADLGLESAASEPVDTDDTRKLRILSARLQESRAIAADIEDHFGQLLGPRHLARLTQVRRKRFADYCADTMRGAGVPPRLGRPAQLQQPP